MTRLPLAAVVALTLLATVLTGTASAQETPTCNGVPATIIGSTGNDQLIGTDGDDVIVGLDGNDTIRGLGGNDLICGDNGRDRLFGGEGNDTILGGKKNDIIKGDQGRDTLFGNQGNDRVVGGGGVDTIDGGSGIRDTLTGKAGADTCTDAQALATRYFTCEQGVPIVSVSPIEITRTSSCADSGCSTIAPTIFITYSAPGSPQQSLTTGDAQQVQTTIDVPVAYDLQSEFFYNPGWTLTVFIRDDWSGRSSNETLTEPAIRQELVQSAAVDQPDLTFAYTVEVQTG